MILMKSSGIDLKFIDYCLTFSSTAPISGADPEIYFAGTSRMVFTSFSYLPIPASMHVLFAEGVKVVLSSKGSTDKIFPDLGTDSLISTRSATPLP